ncbi:hypothetical protein ACFXJ5_20450 [Streptomyces sp. NPDC059373]
MIRANPRFARLWSNGSAGALSGDRKTVAHPVVAGLDFRIVTYTAEPDTAAESNLDALRRSVRATARPADR